MHNDTIEIHNMALGDQILVAKSQVCQNIQVLDFWINEMSANISFSHIANGIFLTAS